MGWNISGTYVDSTTNAANFSNGSSRYPEIPPDNDGAKSRQMARVRTKNTSPELAVRRALHARGFRFRLHRKDLPGTPDIVLPKHRVCGPRPRLFLAWMHTMRSRAPPGEEEC